MTNIPFILCLLFSCGPFAIGWPVISVIVNSLYGKFRERPSSHILYKYIERVPSFANLDSSFAIILVGTIIWIKASLAHLFPDIIFWPSGTYSMRSMFEIFSKSIFNPKAATAFSANRAWAKIRSTNKHFLAASTTAQKYPLFMPPHYGEPAKYFSFPMNYLWHELRIA